MLIYSDSARKQKQSAVGVLVIKCSDITATAYFFTIAKKEKFIDFWVKWIKRTRVNLEIVSLCSDVKIC